MKNQNQILEDKVKERTKELFLAKEKAEESDRLKTAFLRMISHEIRTPLYGLLGFGSLLIEPGISEKEKQDYFGQMTESGERLTNTINNYLDISMIVSGSITPVPVKTQVKKHLQVLYNSLLPRCRRKNLGLELRTPADSDQLTIETDPTLLLKILDHLLDNAIKFTAAGGISFGYTIDGELAVFFVTDSGAGIGMKERENIFKNFSQADLSLSRPYEGNGLGLSIVKGLAELLGGTLTYESEKNNGTTFLITFPIK